MGHVFWGLRSHLQIKRATLCIRGGHKLATPPAEQASSFLHTRRLKIRGFPTRSALTEGRRGMLPVSPRCAGRGPHVLSPPPSAPSSPPALGFLFPIILEMLASLLPAVIDGRLYRERPDCSSNSRQYIRHKSKRWDSKLESPSAPRRAALLWEEKQGHGHPFGQQNSIQFHRDCRRLFSMLV